MGYIPYIPIGPASTAIPFGFTGPTPAALPSGPSYLMLGEASKVARSLPRGLLAAWFAAVTSDKVAALVQASADVDGAMRYQGRRFDLNQPLEFPRVAREAGWRLQGLVGASVLPVGPTDVVWDFDETNKLAVVPLAVKQAVLYQADSILDNSRAARLDAQHDGVTYDQTGGLAESYKGTGQVEGLRTGLARRAFQLLQRYRATAGRLQ